MKLGKIFGIDIELDFSVAILAFLIASGVHGSLATKNPDSGIILLFLATAFVTAGVVGSILAHELGHALTGFKFGIPCSFIKLHILGGVAGMSSKFYKPKAEFWVALAGPVVSFALGIVFTIFSLTAILLNAMLLAHAFSILGSINIILGIFNLIPAFPMDGGRIFRSVAWAINNNYIKSTHLAVTVGKGFAILGAMCGVAMIFGLNVPFFGTGAGNGIWLTIIAAFVYFLGKRELDAVI